MSKKFILFIVEGPNDKKELDAILHTPKFLPFRDKYEPAIVFTKGDITTDTSVTEKNVLGKLNSILLDWRRGGIPYRNISVSDIQEVVQITDSDGVFIPNENIQRGEVSDFYYESNVITTRNVDGAIGRNRKKAAILDKLIHTEQIGNVQYSIYFVSCNMDHVLFNKRNCTKNEKCNGANDFMMRCAKNSEILLESIFSDLIMSDSGYDESWTQIHSGIQSLSRKTNINLFFDERAKNAK